MTRWSLIIWGHMWRLFSQMFSRVGAGGVLPRIRYNILSCHMVWTIVPRSYTSPIIDWSIVHLLCKRIVTQPHHTVPITSRGCLIGRWLIIKYFGFQKITFTHCTTTMPTNMVARLSHYFTTTKIILCLTASRRCQGLISTRMK